MNDRPANHASELTDAVAPAWSNDATTASYLSEYADEYTLNDIGLALRLQLLAELS